MTTLVMVGIGLVGLTLIGIVVWMDHNDKKNREKE